MTKVNTIKEYFQTLPKDIQEKLEEVRKVILEEVPGADEKISYAIPAVMANGKYIIYYSAWKKHISLYPFTGEMGKEFPETKDYNTSGKGTIQFPYDKPLPINLIKKITQFRLKEVQESK